MKKVLIIANSVSMIDLFNRDNINILQELGYKVFVACNFDKGNIIDNKRIDLFKIFLSNKSIEFFNLPIPRNPMDINSIFTSYRILSKIANIGFSIVHCHSPIASALTRIVFDKHRKTFQTKVIYSAHGFHFFKGSSILSWLVYYPIEKMLSHKTDLILTINKEDFNLAKSKFNSNVEYVPGIGIDLKRFGKNNSFEEKKIIRKDKNSIFIGSIGQISKRKNHLAILKALNIIKNSNIHYFIAGFGELESKLIKYANKNNLQNNIHIL
jgi:glycosyltransferase involved in cell wall biosynthesis